MECTDDKDMADRKERRGGGRKEKKGGGGGEREKREGEKGGRAEAVRLPGPPALGGPGSCECGRGREDVCQQRNNRTGFTQDELGRDELTAQR